MIFLILILLILAAGGIFIGKGIYQRKIHIWLPGYCGQFIKKRIKSEGISTPIHILFCFVDHFEPGWNKADLDLQRKRVDAWVERYPVFAEKFIDSDGYHPRHTWFYPPHYFKEEHILKLLSLCKKGFGEIEMHLHHSRMEPFPDTSETLREKINDTLRLYSQYGIFKTSVQGNPQLKYGFIHGDWALDNSREQYCGVNDELTILKETGCYADFTFPSYMIESQPRMVNTIYYAKDNSTQPKSYEKGEVLQAGRSNQSDLMMIQGPLTFRWKKKRGIYSPAVEDGEISGNNPPLKERVDSWIKTNIHVWGREDWIIVKVFTHGAPGEDNGVLLGEPIKGMHSYLNEKYNDGNKFFLHYVTARELFNIIRAAEDNKKGNPNQFRNYEVEKYFY